MNSLVNNFKSVALSFGEMLTPLLRESKFKETGVLTPEEFIAAGDHLVHHCPTWSWASASDPSRVKDFLPEDKQYLITKHVPCHQRCRQMDYDTGLEKIIHEDEEGTNNEDEWVDTHHYQDRSDPNSNKVYSDLLDRENSQGSKTVNADDDEDEDEFSGAAGAVDMDSYLESNGLEEEEDPNRYIVNRTTKSNYGVNDEDLLKTRTYNLHITYDKYYQVPRFWLIGYNEDGNLLTIDQMKEDFSQDHADKTITLEAHPQVANIMMATIHPCRHAAVMKRLIEQCSANGKEITVLQYLFVFLKFVQAVIPCVEYDFTRSVEM